MLRYLLSRAPSFSRFLLIVRDRYEEARWSSSLATAFVTRAGDRAAPRLGLHVVETACESPGLRLIE